MNTKIKSIKMKKLFLLSTALFLSAALLNSCGNKEKEGDDKSEDKATGWSDTEKDAYMKACVNSAKSSIGEEQADDYCSCTMNKIMDKYPSAVDLNKVAASEKNDIIMDVAKECMGEFMNSDEPTSSSSEGGATNWSQASYDAYMNSCVSSAKEAMGEEKATSYCSCTAESLQITYPDETTLGSLSPDDIQKVAMECLGK